MMRSNRGILARVTSSLALTVLLLGGACAVDPSPEEVSASAKDARAIVITAATIERLAPGEQLTVDLRIRAAYTFDYQAEAIDYSRIRLISNGGEVHLMSEWLDRFQQEQHHDLRDMPARSFRLAGGYYMGPPAGMSEAGVGVNQSALRRSVDCSDDGCLCLVCYGDRGGLVYCDVYWLCGG